jgi:hypothetical protein
VKRKPNKIGADNRAPRLQFCAFRFSIDPVAGSAAFTGSVSDLARCHMSTTRAFLLLLLSLLLAGCAQSQRPSGAQSWPHSLSAEEQARCKQVAWQAAESREMWERFKPKRMTSEPVKLDERGIQYYLDQKRFDTVEVAIPSGGRVGWHPSR